MRAREVGFTLLEYVITVGIAAILLAAGGFWLLAMHPAALAGALDDFDANLAAAKAIAASSGNGATLVFAPQTNGSMGYTLTVYSGRPNAADAVSATNVMIASSAASVSEAHFGKPPFAIFLSSAGYPTGTANYPALSAQGAPSFNVIAAQPPCPSGGIELTFTSPQGATATRTLPCNQVIAQSSAPDATPTPNAPHVSPTYLLAHDTTDAGPLKFKAAEYGYFQPFVAQGGPPCSTIASETGAAPAVYTSPYPDSQPTGDPNDPPAWFALAPVLHNGGMCTATVADAYGQSGSVTVQVMGDLTASTTSLSLQVGKGNGVVAFTKTFDSEQLLLSAGGACLGIVTAAPASGSYPSSPSTTPANANVTVTPVAQGACTMIVQDQYGERIPIGINVKAANQPFASWPATLVLGAGGSAVGATSGTLADADTSVVARIAPVFNALLGGGIARAAAGAACYGLAMNSAKSGIDATLPPAISAALGIYVDTSGCIVNASDVPIAAGEM
ncbi:MAG TPA: hypothetical protein VMA98_05415, partial [Candidatus Acidoferrales bacterium]|nr:hypothetical protein [Candidatus Acidoferrales bacterium]